MKFPCDKPIRMIHSEFATKIKINNSNLDNFNRELKRRTNGVFRCVFLCCFQLLANKNYGDQHFARCRSSENIIMAFIPFYDVINQFCLHQKPPNLDSKSTFNMANRCNTTYIPCLGEETPIYVCIENDVIFRYIQGENKKLDLVIWRNQTNFRIF